MKLRKFTAIILTLVMAVSMLSAFALAEGDPTFRGDNIEAKAGETITYNVFIENNPGIAGYKVQVDFSPEAFDLESADATDEFQNPIQVRLGDFCKDEYGDYEGNVVGNPTKYGCVALYFNVENVNTDGVIFTVTLKVKDDAVSGTHAVKIRYDDRNTVYVDDATGSVLYAPEFKTVDGSVTVTGGAEGTIDNEAVGPTQEELEEMENDRKTSGPRIEPEDETTTTEPPSETDLTPPVEGPTTEQSTGSTGGNSENTTGTTGTTDGNGEGDVNNTQLTNDGTETSEAAGTVTHNVGTAGNNVTKIILIAVAAVVVIAVILFFVLKAMTGKNTDTSADTEDKDLDINEVLGWNKPEDDFNDGDDDDDDVDD